MAKVLCMEIGVLFTRIVEMDYQSKKPKVYRCLQVQTPEDAVRDGYLEREKMPVLAEKVKEVLTSNKIRTKRVIFSVFSGRIISREIILPGVKPHQINAVIESNVTEYFPIELEDYKLTHMLIKTFREGENAGKHKVLVLAAEKTLLKAYDELAGQMGLRLADIDYAGNSALQTIRHSIGSEAAMVVKIEVENAIISIIQKGELVLQRNLNYERGQRSNEEQTKEEMADYLANTMLRIIDFYTSNNENVSINQIHIMGGCSRDKNLLPYMSGLMGMPCRLVDTVRGVTIQKLAADADLSVYAAVIGAGVSSVGFANEKEQERNETNYVSASLLLILFFIVAIAAMLAVALVPYNIAVMDENGLLKKQQEYAKAEEVYQKHESTLQVYQHIAYGNALTMHSNDGILDFFSELEQKLPGDVEMTEFASDDEKCVMTMRVADKETAAGVIRMLREYASVSEVTVESIIEETEDSDNINAPGEGETMVNFTVTCFYLVEEKQPPTTEETQEVTTQQNTEIDG